MLSRGSYSPGAGPIYLSELECSGSESSLINCLTERNLPPGLVNCDHSMDVSVQCQGMCIDFVHKILLVSFFFTIRL